MPIRPHRRRRWRAATAAVSAGVVLAATVTAAVSASAAAATPSASKHAVVSGNARFEVLSPTLIRTEYAGNGAFEDDPTFNAIGRDGFAPTHFTQKTANGWLTIDTGQEQLRYKVGSGAFTSGNLVITERAGKQAVTSQPWAPPPTPSCQFGVLCEAEGLNLNGVSVAGDHGGYTGTGFAAGFQATGNSMTFQVTAATAGTYQLSTRYANSTGGDGQNITRTLSVTVGSAAATTLSLPTTANWDTWGLATVPVTLNAGVNTVVIARGASDSGNVNIDSLAVVNPGAAYPGPGAPQAQPCAFGTVCQAESGALTGGASLQNNHNDYAGSGFVGGLSTTTASDAIAVTGVPAGGQYQLQLRYANWQTDLSQTGAANPRTISVAVGSGASATATLAPTSSWDSWRTVSIPVTLAAGDNTVTLGCPTADSVPRQSRHRRGDEEQHAAAGPARCARRLPARPGRPERRGPEHAGPALPGRLVAAGRHRLRYLQLGRTQGLAASVGRRQAVSGRVRVRLRPGLPAGPEGPRDPDRPVRAATALGLRRLVLRVLRPQRCRLREHDPADLPVAEHAAGRAGHGHRFQGRQHLGRLGDGPVEVP